MFERFKNLKLIQKVKKINPKSLLLNFVSSQNSHRKEYVDLLADNREIQTLSDERRLEVMVREQIKTEFPNLVSSATYELLVDAVVHNIKKKQLQTTDDIQFE